MLQQGRKPGFVNKGLDQANGFRMTHDHDVGAGHEVGNGRLIEQVAGLAGASLIGLVQGFRGDPDEHIEVVSVAADQLQEKLARGEIRDAKTMLGLLLAGDRLGN